MKKILFVLMLYVSSLLMSCAPTHTLMMSNIYRLDSSGNTVESWSEIPSSDIIKNGESIQFGPYILGGSVPYKIETYAVTTTDNVETLSGEFDNCNINRLTIINNLENDIILLMNKESQLKMALKNINKDDQDYKKYRKELNITKQDIQVCRNALYVLKESVKI